MKRYRIDVAYQTNDGCPLCQGKGKAVGYLADGVYHFGNLDIPYPEISNGTIPIMECMSCGLIYKFYIPEADYLLSVLSRVGNNVWRSKFRSGAHDVELNLVKKYSNKAAHLDIIDIGCSDGGVLYEFRDIAGRHSGLDIVINSKCKKYITGEIIQAFVDSNFSWSGAPYDVVTAFDLLEHLYEPRKAFENFTELLKPDGILIIQTGNPRFAGGNYSEWWYLRLFEHHICWPEGTLVSTAHRYGLEASVIETEHKGRIIMPGWKKNALWVIKHLRNINLLHKFVLIFYSRDIRTLAEPFSQDHLTLVLKKKREY